MTQKELFDFAKAAYSANKTAPVAYNLDGKSYSYTAIQEACREEMNKLFGSYSLWRANKNIAFELMEQMIDDVIPQKVLEQYGAFAEIKVLKQGQKAIFTQKVTLAAKKRAKQFITKVGLNGLYEVFKLDGQSYELATSAYGGAAQIGFEEYLDSRVELSDVLDIMMEGLDECVYLEIERALKGAVKSIQSANKSIQTAFDEKEMDRLIGIAKAYGTPVIYCTYEFAATMIPATGWVSEDMKNAKWNNGYLGNYKGNRVVVLNQSYEDNSNTVKTIDPRYCWIIPTGTNEKPIKIALEGQTIIKEYENRDLSREIQAYKKMGVAAVITNNLCVYINTSVE